MALPAPRALPGSVLPGLPLTSVLRRGRHGGMKIAQLLPALLAIVPPSERLCRRTRAQTSALSSSFTSWLQKQLSASSSRIQGLKTEACLAPRDAPGFFPSTAQCWWLSLKVSLHGSEIKEANPSFWGKDQKSHQLAGVSEFQFHLLFGARGSLSSPLTQENSHKWSFLLCKSVISECNFFLLLCKLGFH